MARKFKIEGTKTFLYWAIGLMILTLWCVKDGWFPSDAVVQKHPMGTPEGDRFYLFNKSLAILTFMVSAICAYIHKVVK